MKLFLNRTLFLVSMLLVVSLHAGLYDNTYTLSQESNQSVVSPTDTYMTDDFIEIIRFDRVSFDDGMDNKGVQSIINKIK